IVKQPLELLEAVDQFDVFVNVAGGGTSAQAEAVRHGIARALVAADPERRPSLKRAGFLTRDSRKVERKKYGRPGARKRVQDSKCASAPRASARRATAPRSPFARFVSFEPVRRPSRSARARARGAQRAAGVLRMGKRRDHATPLVSPRRA